ncbi:MAG: EAL domain-containing protein [Armatimonadetes bacterium]|nr:EAL domain-containing protein [Armatimonadota bacterium]
MTYLLLGLVTLLMCIACLRFGPIHRAWACIRSRIRRSEIAALSDEIDRLRESEARLLVQTSAVCATSDQIIITDAKGQIEFTNPAFEKETGYELEEIIGKNPRFLRSGSQEKAFYALMWKTILNGRTWHGEITNRRKDGSQYVAETTITPVKNEEGRIYRFVAINRNITEKKVFEKRMDYLAHYDILTGLPNRLLMGHKLTQTLTQAARNNTQAAVMFLDLDGFKLVNDTMGHKAGDELLKLVAERLTKRCGDSGIVGRMGGDEFVIVLPHVDSAESAAMFTRRILKSFSKPFDLQEGQTQVSTSVGISLYPEHGVDVEALVKNADAAMYRAKERGKNSYCFYDEALSAAATERITMEAALKAAIEREEFVVYYQPRVNVVTGDILGAEALIRWRHPELGLVFPDEFLPLAEETGLIVPISEWVLRKACVQNKAWQDAGLPAIELAVNVSARQFQRRSTPATIKSALVESGLEPKYLELELTENAVMSSPDAAAAALGAIRKLGVRISIDDFGTGSSSISYLRRFPVDTLKIDRSFIRGIPANTDSVAITQAVVVMAHSLNLTVVAEGVETLEQLKYLFELGCDQMQGYFMSAALPADQFEELLRRPANFGEDESRAAA